MIRLTLNVLHSALVMLRRVERFGFSSVAELIGLDSDFVDEKALFELTERCGWIGHEVEKPILLSRGATILHLHNVGQEKAAFAEMLRDYVLKARPAWRSRIPYGRKEVALFLSQDENACFEETDLLSPLLTPSIREWWDSLAAEIRKELAFNLEETGRQGEQLSLRYEKGRTQQEPFWAAFESNLLGYDIISVVHKGCPQPLLVEVKASVSPISEAVFHIFANEWAVASNSSAYVFHLWSLLHNEYKLAVLTPEEVFPHIPTNHLSGEWESVKVRFSSFREKFLSIS